MADENTRSRTYIAIDLKSFYASVECVERGLDPLRTNLVVADRSRTAKTICLAVSPSLKAYGLPGRARLFEVEHTMSLVNAERRLRAPGHRFSGESFDADELAADPTLGAAFIAAKPRMSHYLHCSAKIYEIYLKYVSDEDIHVYSIDEVFIDATGYLRAMGMTGHDMARTIVRDIYRTTGITATAGIGTNLYLAKVAMDIVAKHMPADADGVRVAELDERSYRRMLWSHRPLTDFWRVGRGYARKLERQGLMTMGDIARCSLGRASDYHNEDLLYRMFGVNAELLIDHAWGWEPCTIADIKRYRPADHSISSGQVLTGPADFATGRLIVKEMADDLALELVEKRVLADRIALMVGYDVGSLDPARLDSCATDEERAAAARAAKEYAGAVSLDHYGRRVPKPANGSIDLGGHTASGARIRQAMTDLYDRIVNPLLQVRRLTVVAGGLRTKEELDAERRYEQPDLFAVVAADADGWQTDVGGLQTDGSAVGAGEGGAGPTQTEDADMRSSDERETRVQETLLNVKRRFGRNAVVKGMNLEQGATGLQRHTQIGGHAA
ncbi:type VI secretion protein ImpB [Bifidobacterium simiarum]|uniref:Y-family DNA polymerase n=1 Tax=Bifidobacterium simiarum TaxID=2045441 RepID=UPI001BDBFC86|nr:type VI secretion protein ImpB [Bifidobacterium simiarum]MBT1165441.1 type VI secretion protein ImpB [Bifidobacterium simiarum]